MTATLLHRILSSGMECCCSSRVRWKRAGEGRWGEVAVAFLPLMHISLTGELCAGGDGGELDRKRLEVFLPPIADSSPPLSFFPHHWLFQQPSQPFSAAAARFVK